MNYKTPSSELPVPADCKELVRGLITRVNQAHWLVGGVQSKMEAVTHLISHYMGSQCVCYRDTDGLIHLEIAAIKARQRQPVLTDLRGRIAKGVNRGMEKRWVKDHSRTTKYRIAYKQEIRKPPPDIEGFTMTGTVKVEPVKLERREPGPMPACVGKPEWRGSNEL